MSPRTLILLFVAFRLAALLLYRPGGLIAVADPYPALPPLPVADLLLRQLAWGLLLLPFEGGTLWLLLQLLRRGEAEDEARRRAALWALSPLPLWVWLTGATPLVSFVLLAAFWIVRLGRRSWLWAALPLALATVMEGPRAELTALLLPFILLLVPEPAAASALFTLGALLAGPVSALLGVTGTAATAFQVGYVLAMTPALAEWLLMLQPVLGWHRWRGRLFALSAAASVGVLALALLVLAPRELRPARLAASPLRPALEAMQRAPGGWFVTDSHALWEQAVALGVGPLTPRVASPRNLEALRAQLLAEPSALWLLQSPGEGAPAVVEPLVAGFFAADEQRLESGTRLRRFVSTLDAPLAPVAGTFADGVTLGGVRLPERAVAGGLLPVELHWQGGSGNQKLFLHLLAPDGTRVSQRDAPPGLPPDRHALPLPAALPPGRYTLVAGRYTEATGARVALSRGGDTIALGEVEVVAP